MNGKWGKGVHGLLEAPFEPDPDFGVCLCRWGENLKVCPEDRAASPITLRGFWSASDSCVILPVDWGL